MKSSPGTQEMMELWLQHMMKILKHVDGSQNSDPDEVMERVIGSQKSTSIETLERINNQREIQMGDFGNDKGTHINDEIGKIIQCEDQRPGELCAYDGQKCPVPPLPNCFLVCVHTSWTLMRCPPGTNYYPHQQICSTISQSLQTKMHTGKRIRKWPAKAQNYKSDIVDGSIVSKSKGEYGIW